MHWLVLKHKVVLVLYFEATTESFKIKSFQDLTYSISKWDPLWILIDFLPLFQLAYKVFFGVHLRCIGHLWEVKWHPNNQTNPTHNAHYFTFSWERWKIVLWTSTEWTADYTGRVNLFYLTSSFCLWAFRLGLYVFNQAANAMWFALFSMLSRLSVGNDQITSLFRKLGCVYIISPQKYIFKPQKSIPIQCSSLVLRWQQCFRAGLVVSIHTSASSRRSLAFRLTGSV